MGREVPQKKHPAEPDGTQRYDYPVYGRFSRYRQIAGCRNREVAAINVMPRVVAVKNSLEGKHHIVGIHFTSGSKPVGFLKRNIATQVEAIGRAVVEYFPAFGKFRHQAIGIGIDIQQSIIKLGGKGIDN